MKSGVPSAIRCGVWVRLLIGGQSGTVVATSGAASECIVRLDDGRLTEWVSMRDVVPLCGRVETVGELARLAGLKVEDLK